MHHEEHASEEIQKALSDLLPKLGATGRYPGGKLTENDEGEIAFALTTYKGKVIIEFGKRIRTLGISPDEARELAKTLLKKAALAEA